MSFYPGVRKKGKKWEPVVWKWGKDDKPYWVGTAVARQYEAGAKARSKADEIRKKAR